MQKFQPTRPLRGATTSILTATVIFSISTHAPLAGRDLLWIGLETRFLSFQPTRPLRGATPSYSLSLLHCYDFNPRAPCGARPPVTDGAGEPTQNFNPRAPCGARRGRGERKGGHDGISTHAPLAGRDAVLSRRCEDDGIFQPTRPLRGATIVAQAEAEDDTFQPTRPLRGATARNRVIPPIEWISTHAPLAGRDTSPCTP